MTTILPKFNSQQGSDALRVGLAIPLRRGGTMNCISLLSRLGALAAGMLLAATAAAQNKPAGPAATNASAPAIAEPAQFTLGDDGGLHKRLLDCGIHIGSVENTPDPLVESLLAGQW